MDKKDMKQPEPGALPMYPALEKVVPGARRLVGFIGPTHSSTSQTGIVRLYPSLDDLDDFVEFNQADVLHHESTPAHDGGVAVWLGPNAQVTTHSLTRMRVSELPRRRPRLGLNSETIRSLTLGGRVIKPTDNCISRVNCTWGAGDCTGGGWCDTTDCTGTQPGGC